MDNDCPIAIFVPFFFFPSLRYNITHSSNFNFYLGITHFWKKKYFQFYASRKALVIKTNLSLLYPSFSLFSFRLFFCSFRVGLFLSPSFFFLLLVCSCFLVLLLSIPAFFFVPFVDVVLWCLKTVVYGNQVRSESLKDSAGTSTKLIYVVYIYIFSITTTQLQIQMHEG